MTTTLLTGSSGFIGTYVANRLNGVVVGIDSWDERVHKQKERSGAKWFGDFCDTPQRYLDSVDAVIHLAAQVSVADSAVDPGRYITQNTLGTALFLKRLPKNVRRLVVASSMSVYGEGGVLVTEDAPVCPTSVYGLTKYDQERLCLMWGEQHGVPVAALRFFNVYGPGQALTNPYTGVLANFAKALLGGKPPTIYEDGLQTRDFIFASDVARAVCLAAQSTVHGVFNICTGKATTVLGAAQHLRDAMRKPNVSLKVTGETRPGDIRHCTGSPEKAERELGFRAEVSFEDGITTYAKAVIR